MRLNPGSLATVNVVASLGRFENRFRMARFAAYEHFFTLTFTLFLTCFILAQLCYIIPWGATTFSITTFNIMTLSIKGLYVTLSITMLYIMLNVVKLNVALFLLLCWVSLCWVSLCWMSLCWVSWHPTFCQRAPGLENLSLASIFSRVALSMTGTIIKMNDRHDIRQNNIQDNDVQHK